MIDSAANRNWSSGSMGRNYDVGVKAPLEKHGTRYFSTNSDRKAAVVERFDKNLKTAMCKYFYVKCTYK